MRILVAVDQSPYSASAVNEVARLARNTLANVTLLGVVPKKEFKKPYFGDASKPSNYEHSLAETLHYYRERFLGHFESEDSPYISSEFGYKLTEVRKGVWEELRVCLSARKELKTRIRIGAPVKEILAESQEQGSDLIVVGCNTDRTCGWDDGTKIPQEIANSAACSVLVTKEEKRGDRVVCCLDQDTTSQQSLEMINQLVTLHHTALEIVGLTEGDGHGLEDDVYRKMNSILKYYHDRQIYPYIKVVPLSSVESFVSEEASQGLMALWMGKESILEKIFPRSKVNWLIEASQSSVLLLR